MNLRFATTRWSLVLAAAGDDASGQEALGQLCSLYWYPVYAFVRRQARSSEEALDLTQGFFTRLIEKGDLRQADRERGRFRSFLLAACRHYVANERDREHAIKRGGAVTVIPIDAADAEQRYAHALSIDESPERLYERQWALTLIRTVLGAVRAEYERAGDERLFDRLSGNIFDPGEPQAEMARDLDMSVAAVKTATHRLRKRFRASLREHIAETVASEDDVDAEIRHLMTMVST